MTAHTTHSAAETPDAAHGWIWGCTAAILPATGFGYAGGIAALIAALMVLVPPSEHRRRLLGALAAGAITTGLIVPLLSNLTPWRGDSAIYAAFIIGAASGGVAELAQPGLLLPGLRSFRILFLEMCVLTGLLGGFLLIPSLKFHGAADAAGRLTFASALVLLFVMIPAALTAGATRLARRAVRARHDRAGVP